MRRRMLSGWMRVTAVVAALVTGTTALLQAPANGNLIHEATERRKPRPISELPAGKTDKLTAAQWKSVDVKRAREEKAKRKKVRLLSHKEMRAAIGRGPYRNAGLNGNLPWQRSLRNVNMSNGNLSRSFTDIQVTPARGTGLTLQRTYNSNDSRVGPFGIGWTHVYDIRMEEDAANVPGDDSLNFADRIDFFGGKHKYHRDADGLYSPPAYMYDEMSSEYDHFLTDGPQNVLSDTERGMDGGVKHFVKIGNERVCDTITDRNGNATVLTYNTVSINGVAKGLLNTVTDPSGRMLTFTWDNLNPGDPVHPAYRVTQVDSPQYSVAYAYNADFNLLSSTLDAGDASHLNRKTQYEYTSITDVNGSETGLLSSVTDPLMHKVSYTYGLTLPTTYGYDAPTVTGTVWVQKLTEPAGVDATGAEQTQDWLWSCDGENSSLIVSAHTDYNAPNQAANGALYVRVFSDLFLRTTSVHDNYVSDAPFFSYVYDSAFNIVQTFDNNGLKDNGGVMDYLTSRPNLYHIEYFTFGPHGNQLTHQMDGYPGVETITYYNASQYFQRAAVTDMNGHTSTFGVGSNNDPNPGNRGSVLWVHSPGYNDPSSAAYHKQTTYQYNGFGQKTSETSLNGVVTNYGYGDTWGNMTQTVQDPHVTPGDSHLARTTTLTYDVGGHIIGTVDPMGRTNSFTVNALGESSTASFPATATSPAETVTYSYDAAGHPLTITDSRGTTTMAYESGCDRVHSVTDPVNGTISYTYLTTGERATVTLPDGATWTYHYAFSSASTGQTMGKDDVDSVMHRLDMITDDQGRRVEYALNPDGAMLLARTNQVYNTTTGTPTLASYQQAEYTYDGTAALASTHHWVTQIKNTFHWLDANNHWQAKLLVQNDYTHDATGQRLTKTTSYLDANGNVASRTEQYAYDTQNQLSTVDYGDGQTQTYHYDAVGNRLSKSDSVNGNESYAYNAANMLTSRGVNQYVNDTNGNTLTGGGRTNTWDGQNRLIQCVNGANVSSFVYGSDGFRHQSTVNGTTTDFVFDGSAPVQERNHATGTKTATYLAGPQGPEYRRDDTTTQIRWYLFDALGSVLGEVDPNGNVTSSRQYDVYGLVRGGNNAGGASSHKFVGQLGHPSEDNTGLIYMRARYYDPTIGRFASEDPGFHGGNWFVYADNNPINEVDKDGKVAVWSEVAWAVGLAFIIEGAYFSLFGNTGKKIGLPVCAFGVAVTAFAFCGLNQPMSVNMCNFFLGYLMAGIGVGPSIIGSAYDALKKGEAGAGKLAMHAVVACFAYSMVCLAAMAAQAYEESQP